MGLVKLQSGKMESARERQFAEIEALQAELAALDGKASKVTS